MSISSSSHDMAATPDSASRRVVYFGHRSVGGNILQGLEEMPDEHQPFGIKEYEGDLEPSETSIVIHNTIGENGHPELKFNEFAERVTSDLGDSVDLAMMKLCYLDISESTDVERVFQEYRSMIGAIKEAHPDLLIAHVTVPLVTLEQGWKAAFKKLLGRPLRGREDNIAREEYNQMIRDQFLGVDPVFDLAYFESTTLDGGRSVREHDGRRYFSLIEEYSSDGGHLNEIGRKRISTEFSKFLIENLD